MKTILIVDDNNVNLITAKATLDKLYRIITVHSGSEALEYAVQNTADLVLLDILMPEMDGFEVMATLREMENYRDTPIIFLTAESDPATETRCLELGALDFISKPFVPAVMRSRVARTLELEEHRRNLATRLDQTIKEVSEIKNKSSQDALTGLWNRTYASEAVNQLIENGVPGALFMIDMDNFKAINDFYGHIAGDHTLKILAETMMKYAKEGDVLCRIGGDEFLTFLNGETDRNQIARHASQIISDICKKLEDAKFETNTSVSIGIAQCPGDGTTFDSLYNAADKALYFVKQNGKNSYHFYDQHSLENTRNAKNVDVTYLQEIMHRSDDKIGSYLMDYSSFQHVYNFIHRIVERGNREIQTLLFTLDANSTVDNPEELEIANAALEQSIYSSLRRVDVSTKYSSHQIIVILMDSNTENGHLIANRIIRSFHESYTGPVPVDYDIVQMKN